MAPTATVPAWFENALTAIQEGKLPGWMKMYAPDAVHEFPFAPEGGVKRLEGRDAITAYMGQIGTFIRFGSLSDVRVREIKDELIVEATGHHYRVPDQTPVTLHYVWFITLKDGKVTHYRDYMSPM
jgi:ketosteroid isomerase-like protein